MDEGEGKGSNETELAERVGTLVNERYRVLRLIGHGSTGAVYACQHVGLDKLVALKILHREMEQNTSFVERFKLEAKAASRLEHPNSVRVLDFGQDSASGALYIAMEYIEGRDLLQVLEEDGPFSAERAVDVMSQILDVLGVAHGLSIVHRDLKPENILLRAYEVDGVMREHVTVCDFGIAQFGARRATSPDHSATSASPDGEEGLVAGTPAYMSPEQARAEPQDARSDLYSAGVVLYQLLTLQLPFYADDAYALALKHCVEVPPPPSRFGAVNPQLEDICLKALSKSRDARYQSAREMRMALQRVLKSPELARASRAPVDPTSKPRRWGLPLPLAPLGTPSDAPAVEMSPAPAGRGFGRVWHWSLASAVAVGVVVLFATGLLTHNQDQRAAAAGVAHGADRADKPGFVRPAPLAQASRTKAIAGSSSAETAVSSAPVPQSSNASEAAEAQASLPAGPLVSKEGKEGSERPSSADAEELLGESGERPTPSAAGPAGPAASDGAGGSKARARPLDTARADKRTHEAVKEAARPGQPIKERDAGVQTRASAVVAAVSVAEANAPSASDLRVYRPDTRPDSHLELGLLPDLAIDQPPPTPVAAAEPVAAPPKARASREARAEAVKAAPPAAAAPVQDVSAKTTEVPAEPANVGRGGDSARVLVTRINPRAGVSKSSVRGALNLEAITDCYRSAVRGGGVSEARVTAELELATSQSGSVTEASLNAPTLPVPLRHCVEQIVRRGRVREADTGNAQATITLAFLPN